MAGDVIVEFNEFPRLAQTFDDVAADCANNAMENYVVVSADRIPWDTGNMHGDTDIDAATPGNPESTLTYLAEYAIHVHEGHDTHPGGPRDGGNPTGAGKNPVTQESTGHVDGRPWTRETLDHIRDDIVQDYLSEMRRWAATGGRA